MNGPDHVWLLELEGKGDHTSVFCFCSLYCEYDSIKG